MHSLLTNRVTQPRLRRMTLYSPPFCFRRLLTAIGIWGLDLCHAAGDCSLEIMQQATFNGFLPFALRNCGAGDPITNLTMSGLLPQSPVSCLAAFELLNTGPNPIPDKGACRTDFLSFLSFIGAIRLEQSGFSYDDTSDVISLNDEGFDALVAGLNDFTDSAGHPVVLNVCEPNYVRQQSVKGFFRHSIANILGDGTRDYNTDSVETEGFTDGSYQPLEAGLCSGCYQTFLDFVQAGTMDADTRQFSFSNFPPFILAKCVFNPQGDDCMNSLQIQKVRTDFKLCAGNNLEVDFVGPLCQAQVSNQILELRLFNKAVFCTLNNHPNVPGCETWDTEYRILPGTLLSDCVDCVIDLVTDVDNLLVDVTDGSKLLSACSSLDDVSSTPCLEELGSVADAFAACSGLSINQLITSSKLNTAGVSYDQDTGENSQSKQAIDICGPSSSVVFHVIFILMIF